MLTEAVQRCSTDHLRAVSHVGVLRFISQLLFDIAGNQRRSSCAHRTSCFDGTCKNNKYDFVTVSRTIFFFFFCQTQSVGNRGIYGSSWVPQKKCCRDDNVRQRTYILTRTGFYSPYRRQSRDYTIYMFYWPQWGRPIFSSWHFFGSFPSPPLLLGYPPRSAYGFVGSGSIARLIWALLRQGYKHEWGRMM